jgi:hypothetical protein
MSTVPVEILRRLAREISEPRLNVYLLLLERRRGLGLPGVSRQELLKLTGYPSRSLEQVMEWLVENKFVTELQAVVELYYFADY